MSAQVTLSIPDEVLDKATHWAKFLGRPVDDFLAEAIQSSLLPLGPMTDLETISNWSDEEVLAATQEELTPAENSRHSELLDKQQAGLISDPERKELQASMIVYQTRLLRKARALHEAVQRGLKEPLQP